MRRFFPALALLASASAVHAQQPAQTVLVPAAVFDGTSASEHSNWIVIVSGNSISYAGPAATATIALAPSVETHSV